MSEKQVSGYYLFVKQRHEEIDATGASLTQGLTEIFEMINDQWEGLPEQEKNKYNELGQKLSFKSEDKPQLFHKNMEGKEAEPISSGPNNVLPEPIESKNPHLLKSSQTERFLNKLTDNIDLTDVPIAIIQFSTYVPGYGENVRPAEVGISVFNIRNGLLDNYATLIDSKEYSKENQDKVETVCRQFALPMPDYNEELQNYSRIFEQMAFFMKRHSERFFKETIVFCRSKNLQQTEACLNWLFDKVDKKMHFPYKLLSLEILIFVISNREYERKIVESCDTNERSIQSDIERFSRLASIEAKETCTSAFIGHPFQIPLLKKGVFYRKQEIEIYLHCQNYVNHPELACLYHSMRKFGVSTCPLHLANRYAFCLLDVLVESFKIVVTPGKHYPTLLDEMKEEEQKRREEMLQKWAVIDYAELASEMAVEAFRRFR